MQNQVEQRRERLLALLLADTFASVDCLSDLLEVSPLTIRRDLDALQQKGLVERLHGGARITPVARMMDKSEILFYTRRGAQVAEKQAIARAAVRLMEKDDVIAVDASTSGLYFARAIPLHLPLTLVTYSAILPVELAGHPDLQIISTGGLLHRRSLCYLGDEVDRTLHRYHPRRVFLGTRGINLLAGCSDVLLPEIPLKMYLAQCAEEVTILADNTKLGKVGLVTFAGLDQVTTLVTDEGADMRMVQAFRDHGLRVIVASILDEVEDAG